MVTGSKQPCNKNKSSFKYIFQVLVFIVSLILPEITNSLSTEIKLCNKRFSPDRRSILSSIVFHTGFFIQSKVSSASTISIYPEADLKDPNNDGRNIVPRRYNQNLQGYKYRDDWTGTSLMLQSLSQAGRETDEDSFPMGRWPDPILRRPASKVEYKDLDSRELKSVAEKLRRTARKNGAVGLAASQCGIDVSMVFLDDPVQQSKLFTRTDNIGEGVLSRKDNLGTQNGIFLINPRIIRRSAEVDMKVWKEQCLVLPPTFSATVLRDSDVTIQYETLDGQTRTIDLVGELARAAQHEMDHDRGILILDHVGFEEMENEKMMTIEKEGHDERMTIAYSRFEAD